MSVCDFPECGRKRRRGGWCDGHSQQWKKGREMRPLAWRSVGASVAERLERRSELAASGCIEWTASLDGKGYGQMNVGGKIQRCHRLSYAEAFGEIPDGLVVNHLCGNPRCVDPEHLEAVTQADNVAYATRLRSDNTSGYRGVSFCGQTGKWRAHHSRYGESCDLGRYDTAEDAALAAEHWRESEYHMTYAKWIEAGE